MPDAHKPTGTILPMRTVAQALRVRWTWFALAALFALLDTAIRFWWPAGGVLRGVTLFGMVLGLTRWSWWGGYRARDEETIDPHEADCRRRAINRVRGTTIA